MARTGNTRSVQGENERRACLMRAEVGGRGVCLVGASAAARQQGHMHCWRRPRVAATGGSSSCSSSW
jgi:hypothetical protein